MKDDNLSNSTTTAWLSKMVRLTRSVVLRKVIWFMTRPHVSGHYSQQVNKIIWSLLVA